MKRFWIKFICGFTFVVLILIISIFLIYFQEIRLEKNKVYSGTTNGLTGVANVLLFQVGEDVSLIAHGRMPSKLFFTEAIFSVILIIFIWIFNLLLNKKI